MLASTLALSLLSCAVAAAEEQPRAPIHIPIRSRLVERRRLSARSDPTVDTPLKDYFNETDLQWYGGNIALGTPPQNFTVVYDSGSPVLLIPTTECGESCAKQKKFDPNASSTYLDGDSSGPFDFGTGINTIPVETLVANMYVRNASETVCITSYCINDTEWFQILNQTAAFVDDPMDGIMGLGPSGGIFSNLVDKFNFAPLFSFFIPPHAFHDGDGVLTLGGIDESIPTEPFQYFPTIDAQNWDVNGTRLYVNGRTSDLLDLSGVAVIFDTGTPNMLFRKRVAEAVYALISPEIKNHTSIPGTYGIPCSELGGLEAQIDMEFIDVDGVARNLTIPTSELSSGPFYDDEQECQTLINVSEDLTLVGASLLKHYYSIWDRGNRTLGFGALKLSTD